MKLNKSTKLNPEAHLIYALRLCIKLFVKHPDLRLRNRVIDVLNEIDNLCRGNRQRGLANRKRKHKDPAYRPMKPFKRIRMAPAAQRVDLDASHDQANFCSNASRDRAFPRTSRVSPDNPATSRDATSDATIDPSRTSPETFGHQSTTSHPASHGAISHPQETANESSCGVTIQPHATSLDASNSSREDGCETSREQAAILHAVSRESMVAPKEPASETSFDSLTRSLEPSHDASTDDENTSCAHPITAAMAIDIIHQFSQELYEPPKHIYAEIVRSVQEDLQIQWSDDRSWRDIIETSFFKAHRYVIFNLLDYIGAWEWFDKQVSIAQKSTLTKKRQPIKNSTAAGKVLDSIWQRCNPHLNHVSSKLQKAQRQRIWLQLHRGRELRSRLAKRLGLGILFSPRIWDLLKLPRDKLNSTMNLILVGVDLGWSRPFEVRIVRLLVTGINGVGLRSALKAH